MQSSVLSQKRVTGTKTLPIVIMKIAGNWKTDAATAPELRSSAAGGVALQPGTADSTSRQGCSRSRGLGGE
ncbi:hypothetical protein NQZ68_000418 [Dissostichus eleginoides]|nr:hypothetical protein NQZ68_000418 [Dissostichus eleginoides]